MKKTKKYRSISLPTQLINKIEYIINELGYWPSIAAFIREAILIQIEKYQKEIENKQKKINK